MSSLNNSDVKKHFANKLVLPTPEPVADATGDPGTDAPPAHTEDTARTTLQDSKQS